MRQSMTAVLERDTTFGARFATEPYEVAWASEARWFVQHVGGDGTVWAKETGGGRKHQATVRLPAEYVAEHVHLAYSLTAYGVQGATTSESHTVLSDALDAAGVYVGMTRGRTSNQLHIVAADLDDAREQFDLALERDRADRGLAAATRAAREAIAGLTAHGPVERVNAERARLAAQVKHAEQQTEQWERAASTLDRQRRDHDAKQQEHRTALAAAETCVEQMSTAIARPFIEQATSDGTAYLASRSRLWEASATRRSARGLGKWGADRAVAGALQLGVGVASGRDRQLAQGVCLGAAEQPQRTVRAHRRARGGGGAAGELGRGPRGTASARREG